MNEPSPHAAQLLRLQNVRKTFGSVRALRGVSLDLNRGEVHAVLGENGAGKSTLIKIITGAHAPDPGSSITIKGTHHSELKTGQARALGIACIYQQPALFPDLSVAENIALRLESQPALSLINWRERRGKALSLLQHIGASIHPDSQTADLSLPEQQLVEMACAIGSGADIVIMDEPTASLTQTEQQRLYQIVRDLKRKHIGIIYISHRLEEIFALADRVTVLRDGASVMSETVRDVHGTPSFTENQLVQWMVGRKISSLFPDKSNAVHEHVVLEARALHEPQSGLSNVSLKVRRGEIVGIAGLVGSGRSELARTIFGITPPSSGDILLEGNPIQPRSPTDAVALGIAYLPEDRRQHGVIQDFTVAQNTVIASLSTSSPASLRQPDAERDCADVQIEALQIKTASRHSPVSELSGGNQQKVALARWLTTKPRVLILDEPTQGVDVGAKSEIHTIIRRLAKDGLAVLMISSDLPEIMGMSDRILVMRDRQLVAELPGSASADAIMSAALGNSAPHQPLD